MTKTTPETALDLEAITREFLQVCGPHDYGVDNAGCACADGDYRPVMASLVREVERMREEVAELRSDLENARVDKEAAEQDARQWFYENDRLRDELRAKGTDLLSHDPVGDGGMTYVEDGRMYRIGSPETMAAEIREAEARGYQRAIDALQAEGRRRQVGPSMTVTYMQGFWGAVDYLESLFSQPAEEKTDGK